MSKPLLLDLFCGAALCYNKSWPHLIASTAAPALSRNARRAASVPAPAPIALFGRRPENETVVSALGHFPFGAQATLIASTALKRVRRGPFRKTQWHSMPAILAIWIAFTRTVLSRSPEYGATSIAESVESLSACWVSGV